VSVAVVGIAAGGLATYEYRKGQEIAALEAAAKEAAAKEAAAREEAARQAAAREAAVKEAAAQETAAREAVARASATEAATREAAARQAAAREAASRQAAARAASQARVASAAPPKNSVAFAEPLSEANAALKASGKTPGDQYLASTSPWAKTLAQQALDSGFLSRLPPNVSAVFGLARPPEGTDVRQLVSKGADEVRTFNVNVANHADIVIFNVNAQSRATKAYLITPDGQLRRAVAYQPGGQSRELSDADGKAGLAREKEFWSARAK
jgi:hypothetical protein